MHSDIWQSRMRSRRLNRQPFGDQLHAQGHSLVGLSYTALGSASAFREYRPLKSYFDRFGGAAVLLGSQQFFPAMRESQPKFPIILISGARGDVSTLINLLLKEIGWFEHFDHHNKMPRFRGLFHSNNRLCGHLFH
jgi:hypothetical protein